MIANNLGIIEIVLSGVLVLGFCAWQYWLVRDAGSSKDDKPPSDPDAR